MHNCATVAQPAALCITPFSPALLCCCCCPSPCFPSPGWRTKDTGATGLALCLAPPGWELKENADNITECAAGSYKADWNRNPCQAVSAAAVRVGV